MPDHRVTVALTPDECLEAVEHAAELWGADWSRLGSGGRLALPVHAGVRRGVVTGRLWTEPEHEGTALIFRTESSTYALKTGAVSVLAVGGAGAAALTLWPLFPKLLAVTPVALVLAVVAWLLIASRLQNSGVEEFLELVASAEEKPGR